MFWDLELEWLLVLALATFAVTMFEAFTKKGDE